MLHQQLRSTGTAVDAAGLESGQVVSRRLVSIEGCSAGSCTFAASSTAASGSALAAAQAAGFPCQVQWLNAGAMLRGRLSPRGRLGSRQATHPLSLYG